MLCILITYIINSLIKNYLGCIKINEHTKNQKILQYNKNIKILKVLNYLDQLVFHNIYQ